MLSTAISENLEKYVKGTRQRLSMFIKFFFMKNQFSMETKIWYYNFIDNKYLIEKIRNLV